MAIVLAIVGMMSGYAIRYNNVAATRQCVAQTQQKLIDIRSALEQHVARFERYPLPAGRSYNATHVQAGREASGPYDTAIDRIAGPPPVLIGGVPYSALNLGPDAARDCWGNKFTYAVTQPLTDASEFPKSANQGGIIVRTGTLSAPSPVIDDAAYVLLSHGESALGASPHNWGGTKRNCNTEWLNPAIRRADKENCDTYNAVFFTNNLQDGDVEEYFFDDILIYASKPNIVKEEEPPPAETSCNAGMVTWGGNCAAPALITLLGLSVTLTNTNSGYTGVALSTCHPNGTRITLGTCLPIGTCTAPSPRGGLPVVLLTGISMDFGMGVCKKYSCCTGVVKVQNIFPCPLLDLPGIAQCS